MSERHRLGQQSRDNSVVVKSVPKCAIVGGNPAKIIGYRDIELYDKLNRDGKCATFDDVKNRQWIEIKENKEYLI